MYFDNASTTQLDKRVFDKMTPYFCDVFANASSTHTYGDKAYQAIEWSRDTIARILNCRHSEIYFTSGGTEADNMALRGVMHNFDKGHLIISSIEHDAVYNTAHSLEREGYDVTYLPVDSDGHVRVSDVLAAIRPDTKLVSIMLVNNETGCIQPIEEISRVTKPRGIILHTDAVQAVGHTHIDLATLGVDMMSMSAHKFGGPKGIGALYISNAVKILPIITGGDQERGYRSGTYNTAGIVGMAYALKISAEEEYYTSLIDSLTRELISVLASIDGVHINGTSPKQPGIINAYIEGIPNKLLVQVLDIKGIAISIGSACSAGIDEPSRTLIAMNKSSQVLDSSIRISLYKYNTIDEVKKFGEILREFIHSHRAKVSFRPLDNATDV